MRSFLEGVGVWIDPVPQRASRVPDRNGGAGGRLPVLDLGGSISVAAPGPRSWRRRVLWRPGRQPQRRHRLGRAPSRPRGGWRARITRGYAVIFRRGWGLDRPRTSAGFGVPDRNGGAGGRLPVLDLGGSISVPLPVLDLGGGGFCGGRGGSLSSGTEFGQRASRPRGDRRARVTRGYAVIFRRGWGSDDPVPQRAGSRGWAPGSAASAAAAAGSGSSTSRSATLAAAGSVAAAGGSLSGGTDSVRALAPARRLESEGNAGLCGHF